MCPNSNVFGNIGSTSDDNGFVKRYAFTVYVKQVTRKKVRDV